MRVWVLARDGRIWNGKGWEDFSTIGNGGIFGSREGAEEELKHGDASGIKGLQVRELGRKELL